MYRFSTSGSRRWTESRPLAISDQILAFATMAPLLVLEPAPPRAISPPQILRSYPAGCT
jgi:hypothetical protein